MKTQPISYSKSDQTPYSKSDPTPYDMGTAPADPTPTIIFIRRDKVEGDGAQGYLVGRFEPIQPAADIKAARNIRNFWQSQE